MSKQTLLTLLPLMVLSFSALADSPKAPTRDIGYAEYYLKEFEAEVKSVSDSIITPF